MYRMMVLVLFCMFVFAGCSKPVDQLAPREVKTVRMLERLSVDIPAEWKLVKNTFGGTWVSVYSVADKDSKEAATTFLKCQGCDPRLEVDLFRRFQLRSHEFSEGSDNLVLSEDFSDDNWQRMKWKGKSISGDFLIWDIFGVEKELAMHFRATCQIGDETDDLAKQLESDMELIYNSIRIEPVSTEQSSVTESEND